MRNWDINATLPKMKHKQKEENDSELRLVSLLEAYVPCFPKTDKDSKEAIKIRKKKTQEDEAEGL